MKFPNFSFETPLDGQIEGLKQQIRLAPAEASLRIYYFQLLCVKGDTLKALQQLQICAQLEPKAAPMARAYREVLRCEALRAEVFAGKRRPFLIGEPPQWLALMIDALALPTSDTDSTIDLRSRALEDAPAVGGEIDGQTFDWLADTDTRLGPVIEFFAQGNYYWLPTQSIRQVAFEKVSDLRDLVWLPCEVTLSVGGALTGFMPARYPLTDRYDDGLRLAHRTEWTEIGGSHVAGHGQRVWVTDIDDYPMLQTRRMSFAG